MIVSSTAIIDGKKVSKYLGLVSGEAIMGANIVKDMFAVITDIVGGRSSAYEAELKKAKDIAISEMTTEATNLGANAILGVVLITKQLGQAVVC